MTITHDQLSRLSNLPGESIYGTNSLASIFASSLVRRLPRSLAGKTYSSPATIIQNTNIHEQGKIHDDGMYTRFIWNVFALAYVEILTPLMKIIHVAPSNTPR